jgi:hypothetical protein
LQVWLRHGVRRIFRREEPWFDFARVPASDGLPTRPALSETDNRRRRWILVGIVVSILLHAAFLHFIGFGGGGHSGSGGAPIPVQLVMETPEDRKKAEEKRKEQEKQKPQEQEKQKDQKPPPPGRLASDSFGDTEAKGKEATETHDKAAGKPEPKPGEAAPDAAAAAKADTPPEEARPKDTETAQKERGLDEAPLPQTQRQLAAGGSPAPPPSTAPPRDDLAYKPTPKPKPTPVPVPVGGSRNPSLRFEPDHAEGLAAKYPGPAASKDEYLAYCFALVMRHSNLLDESAVSGRSGYVHFSLRLRRDGSILWLTDMPDSTPYSDIAARARRMIELAAPGFPPLPNYIGDKESALFEVSFSYPRP